MKVVIAIIAALAAAPVALALTAFVSGLVHAAPDFPGIPEDELGT